MAYFLLYGIKYLEHIMGIISLFLFGLSIFVVLYVPWDRVGSKITEVVNRILDKI